MTTEFGFTRNIGKYLMNLILLKGIYKNLNLILEK